MVLAKKRVNLNNQNKLEVKFRLDKSIFVETLKSLNF